MAIYTVPKFTNHLSGVVIAVEILKASPDTDVFAEANVVSTHPRIKPREYGVTRWGGDASVLYVSMLWSLNSNIGLADAFPMLGESESLEVTFSDEGSGVQDLEWRGWRSTLGSSYGHGFGPLIGSNQTASRKLLSLTYRVKPKSSRSRAGNEQNQKTDSSNSPMVTRGWLPGTVQERSGTDWERSSTERERSRGILVPSCWDAEGRERR